MQDSTHRKRSGSAATFSAEGITMTKREQVTFTLRARPAGDDLRPGTLIASPMGRVVYRVLEVWRVRRAGDHRYALRLVLSRVGPDKRPDGADVLPWPCDPCAPRNSRAGRRKHHSADSASPQTIRQSKIEERAETPARCCAMRWSGHSARCRLRHGPRVTLRRGTEPLSRSSN
jgi:hypothetical protein